MDQLFIDLEKRNSISGEDSISVDFGVMGIRKLMLKYARFNILES